MNEPILCYVDWPWCYFTTQKLSEQTGDGWNDSPYEHNASRPYEPSEKEVDGFGRPLWEITKIAVDVGLEEARDLNEFSVDQINRKCMPWLVDRYGDHNNVVIFAGTPLSEFKQLIRKAGGTIYLCEEAEHEGD